MDPLKKLYRDKNRAGLREFVGKMKSGQIEKLVDDHLISSEGSELFDALLAGSSDSSERRFKIIDLTLKKLRSPTTPPTLVRKLLTCIRLELPNCSSEDIVKIVDECTENIQKDSDIHTNWKDLIPECLRLLSNRGGNVNHYDTPMSISEFVTRSIRSLCQIKWPNSIIIPIAAMFNEIQLSKDEHLQVVNKLCCDLDSLNPDSLPPLIHQLLRFCNEYHAPVVYFRLNDYFYSRLYGTLKNNDPQDSESPLANFDSIEEYSDETLEKSEATCIYYACRGGNAFKKFLATVKTLAKRPGTLLTAPTLLQVLLAAEQQKELCIQIIRSSLNNYYFEELRKSNFMWCTEILTGEISLKSLINTLVENSTKYCHITGEGLLSLSISLITTGGLFPTANKLQELGLHLLAKLVKRKPEAAQQALRMIRDKFGTESVNIQRIAESLKLLCITMPHTIMEHTVILQGILEDCLVLFEGRNWEDHKLVIEAMNNIIRLDSRLRDTLVMICRKGLFSRDARIGKIAVHGFLSILKNLNSSTDLNAQDQCSAFSVLSQISLNAYSLHCGPSSRVNNSSVCMEVISLLRRCFNQSYDVREQLYLALPFAIREKPELLDHVLNILYEHLTLNYYDSDIEALPPLMLNKCTVLEDDTTPILTEPLGRLLFTIQKLLVCEHPAPGGDAPGGWSLSGDGDQFTGISGKLYVILLSIANQLAKCTTVHFNIDDGVALQSIDIDSQTKCLLLQQAISCYEAMMAFRINEWTPTKIDQPQKLLNLQKNYSQLLEYTKFGNSKSKKEAANKKSQKSQSTQKNKENEPNIEDTDETVPKKKTKNTALKLSELMKKNAGFKLPTTVWDFHTLSRSFELLYGKSITWSTSEQLNNIRNKREMHRISIKFGYAIAHSLKSSKLSQKNKSNASKCAMLLYEGCLSRLDDFADFDAETAFQAVECFHEILKNFINNSLSYLPEFLTIAGNIEASQPLGIKISNIAETLMVQLEMLIANTPLTEDPFMNKIILILFQVISTLLHQLPREEKLYEQWIDRLQKFASKTTELNNSFGSMVTSTLLDIVATSAEPWFICNKIAKKLAMILGTNDDIEEESSVSEDSDFKILTPSTAPAVFTTLCSHLNTRLLGVETITGRIKADHQYLQFRKTDQLITAQATLKNRERAVCSELYQISILVRQLAIICSPPGPCCDSIIHLISRLHTILAAVTTHFLSRDQRALQSARFDKLAKECGKPMSQAMDCLISHVERAREDTPKNNTKTKVQRALKDTKHIPRLVYNSELFYKRIHQLSSKMKVDLVQYLSKGNARDFKIKACAVKDLLQPGTAELEDEVSDILEVENDVETDKNSGQGSSDASDSENGCADTEMTE